MVVIVGGEPMPIDNCRGWDVAPLLSLTVRLKLNGLPTAVVGVPEITPVPSASASPVGSAPLLTVQLYGGVPLVAFSACE